MNYRAKTILATTAIGALLVASGHAMAQNTFQPAQIKGVTLQSKQFVNVTTTKRMTRFNPTTHGFKFANTFENNFISELDIRTAGLCGGMVWASLDYFNTGKTIPTQTFEPSEGTTLRDYIYDRQVNSLTDNIDKWAELTVNPFGSRNDEFWRWGLEGKPGGRIDELRRMIDAGKPAPLGLLGCNEGCKGDHQVLAIGYDLGRYKGDLGAYKSDVKIYIYDPNYPRQTKVLRVDEANKKFYYEGAPGVNWRTYFVDSKHRTKAPPTIRVVPKQLAVTFTTGGDDLRGGNDNAHAIVVLRSGRELRFNNINNGRRWINNSTMTVSMPLPSNVRVSDVRSIRIETTFGGGMGGDNWNLDRIFVDGKDASGSKTLLNRGGTPLMRFTGDRKTATFNMTARG